MIFSSCEVRLVLSFLQFLAVNKFCLNRVFQVRICLPYFKLNVKCMNYHSFFEDDYLTLIS